MDKNLFRVTLQGAVAGNHDDFPMGNPEIVPISGGRVSDPPLHWI